MGERADLYPEPDLRHSIFISSSSINGRQNLSPVVLDAFREARSNEWFDARDWVMKNLPSQEYPPDCGVSRQSEPGRSAMRMVGYFYDNLGVFAAHRIVTEDLVIGFFGVGLAEVWKVLQPYVRAEAAARNMEYMIYFENLVARAQMNGPGRVYDKLALRRAASGGVEAQMADRRNGRPQVE